MTIDNAQARPAAVAGAFYPGQAAALQRSVRALLDAAPGALPTRPKAIIVPHAGYIYSGPIAASVYAPLQAWREDVRRIVLLGPTHRAAVEGLAVPACEAFATPLGKVAVDRAAVAALADLPQVVVNDAAHAQEHSLEVQLPFLIEVFAHFTLVPLAVGRASAAAVCEVLERLWGGAETLIVVSSDLSHYLPDEAARAADAATTRAILDLQPLSDHRQACGATPINGLLLAARRRGLQAKLIDLRNSGDTAGDKARVVGYASFAFYPPDSAGTSHDSR